jgi:uncharacterized protein YceK
VKRFLLVILFCTALVLNGCVFIDTLNQPTEADQGSVMVVNITGSLNSTWGSSYEGWLAMLLPKGCVPESLVYTGVVTGAVYDTSQAVADTAALYHGNEPGMDWWGMATPRHATDGGSYSAQLYISIHAFADTGFYYLDYFTGDEYDGAVWQDSVLDQPLTIRWVVGVDSEPVSAHRSAAPDLVIEPNPFSTKTAITVHAPRDLSSSCGLSVYDMTGRRIRDLWSAGSSGTEVIWDGSDNNGRPLGSGVFFIRASFGTESVTKPVLILR